MWFYEGEGRKEKRKQVRVDGENEEKGKEEEREERRRNGGEKDGKMATGEGETEGVDSEGAFGQPPSLNFRTYEQMTLMHFIGYIHY